MKRKKSSLLLIGLLVITMLLGACGTGKPSGGDSDAGKKETLKVGMECDYAPFNWTQANDSNGAYPIGSGEYAGGYDVEIAKRVADSLGRELVIVKTAWDGLPPAVTSGKIDMIIAGMSPTENRKTTLDFSDAYYVSEYIMVVRKGEFTDLKSLSDFSGKKVSAQLGTFNYDLIDQIPGVVKEQALETFSALMVALESGKIDAYIAEVPAAKSAVSANPNLAYAAFPEGKGFAASMEDASIAVGFKKGNSELLEAVNKALAEISAEERDTLMQNALENQPLSN